MRPTVFLLGTSNVKGINEQKLTSAVFVYKYITYTNAEAEKNPT
jgi:hypothetical protein